MRAYQPNGGLVSGFVDSHSVEASMKQWMAGRGTQKRNHHALPSTIQVHVAAGLQRRSPKVQVQPIAPSAPWSLEWIMNQFSSTFLVRAIELLLIVALWDTYGSCHGVEDLCSHFAEQSKLAQVGTITALTIILNTLCEFAREMIQITARFRGRLVGVLVKNLRRYFRPK